MQRAESIHCTTGPGSVNDELLIPTPTLEESHFLATKAVKEFSTLPVSFKRQLDRRRPDLPNIVVYYYGGSAAMKRDSEGHLVPTDNISEVAKPFKIRGIDNDANVLWFQVLNQSIDSCNGRWPDWVSIGNAIYRTSYDFAEVIGHVVFGGTDTMAHLSAALGYMYPNIGIPIITTGAQRSIFEGGADAEPNLYLSLEAAASDIRGTHQAFANRLRAGLHTHKVFAESITDAFYCLPKYLMGEFKTSGLELVAQRPKRKTVPPDKLIYRPDFREGIKVSKLGPTIDAYDLLDAFRNRRAEVLLLLSIGAENVRDKGMYESEMTHIDVIRILIDAGYLVVLGSSLIDGSIEGKYGPAAKALQAGVISGGKITGAALEVGAMRCLALAHKERQKEGPLNSQRFKTFMGDLVRNWV